MFWAHHAAVGLTHFQVEPPKTPFSACIVQPRTPKCFFVSSVRTPRIEYSHSLYGSKHCERPTLSTNQ